MALDNLEFPMPAFRLARMSSNLLISQEMEADLYLAILM